MARLPAVFADLVRLEIELWKAVEARLRAEPSVGLARRRRAFVVSRMTRRDAPGRRKSATERLRQDGRRTPASASDPADDSTESRRE
jgi:hypothetical protein